MIDTLTGSVTPLSFVQLNVPVGTQRSTEELERLITAKLILRRNGAEVNIEVFQLMEDVIDIHGELTPDDVMAICLLLNASPRCKSARS